MLYLLYVLTRGVK